MSYTWQPETLDLTVSSRVGIGTETPSKELDVIGTISATNLNLSGSASAAQFVGNGSSLTGLVTTTGNSIIDGSLTINQNLAVSGNFQLGGNLQFTTGLAINEFSGDGNLTDSSNSAIPTEQAVKTYVDNQISQVNNTLDTKATLNGAADQDFTAQNLTVGRNLQVSGDLEVQGNVIARDTEHIEGNVSLGDEDSDVITITGVVSSAHSSGALQVNSGLHTTGSLSVDGSLTVSNAIATPQLSVTEQVTGSLTIENNLTVGGELSEQGTLTVHRDVYLAVSGGNVGIGTANPSTKLEVAGEIKASTLIASQSGAEYSSMASFESKNPEPPYINWLHNRTGGDPLRYGYIQVGDFGNTKEFRFGAQNGANFTFLKGNVGIGTTTPATKLDVRGHLTLEAGSDPVLYTGTGSSELNRYLDLINSPEHSTASGLKAGGILVSNSYAYANPGKNDLIVKGNVGIGIQNPRVPLDVPGGAIFNRLAIGVVPVHSQINPPWPYETISLNDPNCNLRLHSSNAIAFHAGNDHDPTLLVFNRELQVRGDLQVNASLHTTGSVSVDDSLTVSKAIATANLQIVRDGWVYLDIRSSKAGEDAVIRLYDGVKGSNSEHYWSIHNDDSAGNKLDIRSNNSSKMSLTTEGHLTIGGKVGIGTTNPQGKLDVQGDIRAGNSDLYFTKTDHNHTGIGNANGYAAIENAANYGALMILGRAGTSKGRYVKLWDYLQVNGGMDITGNVGIGTTSPEAKLHVKGNTAIEGNLTVLGGITIVRNEWAYLDIRCSKAGTDAVIRLYDSEHYWSIHNDDSAGNKLDIRSNNSSKMSLTPEGNLTIRGTLRQGSSRELKENINNLTTEEAIETLEELNPIKFNYKADDQKETHLGFIAEEVPELVASQDRKELSPMDIVAVLTKVVKEQQNMISVLMNEVKSLHQKNR